MISLRAASQLNKFIESSDSYSTDSLQNLIDSEPTGRYYFTHGFLNKYNLELTERGNKFIALTSGNDDDALVDLIYEILMENRSFHGGWVLILEYLQNEEEFYQFQANSSNDSWFCYAYFLYEIGVIEEEPIISQDNKEGCYAIKFSQIGKKIQRKITKMIRPNSTLSTGIQLPEGAGTTTLIFVNNGIANMNKGDAKSEIKK